MSKQLRLNFDAVNEENEVNNELFKEDYYIEDNDEDEDEVEDEDILEDSNDVLLYKNRLKKLVNDISIYENLIGVQLSKEGVARLQEIGEYLVSILIFETLEELKKNGKKKIKPNHVDKALDSILNKSSAIDIALDLLNKDISELKKLNTSSAIGKATKFINE